MMDDPSLCVFFFFLANVGENLDCDKGSLELGGSTIKRAEAAAQSRCAKVSLLQYFEFR
jgi:hypothetical protein